MSGDVETWELDPAEYPQWEALVAESPDGSIYSQAGYLEVLCRAAGGRYRVIGARRGEELVGGVALYERPSRFGAYVSPRLLLYFNGLVLRRWDSRYPSIQTGRDVACMSALAGHIAGLGYGSVNLRSLPSVADVRSFLVRGWTARPSYTYVVSLADLEAQWSRVEQNLRRLVKRCGERDGLEVTDDTDFDAFYGLHAVTLGRRGIAAYLPEAAFRRYFEALHAGSMARLYHARLPDGRAIASQLVLLASNGSSYTVSTGGDPGFLKLGAHAFLRWRAFERLAAAGCTSNDLTGASLNDVTHFKSQLGGCLAMSLVLQSRQRRAYAWGTRGTRSYRRARSVLAGAVRRIAGRND